MKTKPTIFHISTVRRAGRRIADRVPADRTAWCGGAITDHDVSAREARRIVQKDFHLAGWERCDACFQRLLTLDFAASSRVED